MKCIACNKETIMRKNSLCSTCWSEISFINCKEVEEIVSIISYNEIAKKLIHLFKYKSPWALCNLFSSWVYLTNSSLIKNYDVIIPVPMHKYKLMTRGYNQTVVLAQKVAKMHGKQLFNNLLIRTKNVVSQSLLDQKSRLSNVTGTFGIKNGNYLTNKKVLILDDVVTTGSTMMECIRTIKLNCNPCKVQGLSIAATQN